jgi:hypothetical protein
MKNSDYNSLQRFNSEPLALNGALSQGYKPSDFSSSGGQIAKKFEGIATDDYLSKNNLHGNYDVKVVQFRGNDYTYVVTTVYFLNEYTNQFLSELENLLKSFTII